MKPFKLIATYLFIVCFSFAAEAYDEEKLIKREFSVNAATVIDIENKFGKVHINTWDRNEVHVNISVVVKGSEKKAKELINGIDINFDEKISSDYLGIKTKIQQSKSNVNYSINYVVNLPKGNTLKLKNSFGDTYVADMDADVDIDVKYGNLTVGNLPKSSEISLEFGRSMSNISSVNNCDLNLKYSKITIDNADAIDVDAQHSDLILGVAKKIDFDMKYCKLNAREIRKADGEQAYSEFLVDVLKNSLELSMKYNVLKINHVQSSVSEIFLDSQFSKMKMNLDPSFTSKFLLDFQYSDLQYSGKEIEFDKIIKDTKSCHYEGFMRDPKTQNMVRVISGYGDLVINMAE